MMKENVSKKHLKTKELKNSKKLGTLIRDMKFSMLKIEAFDYKKRKSLQPTTRNLSIH